MTFREILLKESVDLELLQREVSKNKNILVKTSNGKWYTLEQSSLDSINGDSIYVTTRDGHQEEILIKDITKIG